MKTLFLAWQNSETRRWFPIGQLTCEPESRRFLFRYLRGVETAMQEGGFEPLPSFRELDPVYESEELFPLFANRVLSQSRPDYKEFLSWMSLPSDQDIDPIELLARSGGQKVTDSLEVFAMPEERGMDQYSVHFFVHGLRHMAPDSLKRADRLKPGERLLPMHDFQNPSDSQALMLRTAETEPGDVHNVGYCPRYLFVDTFSQMVKEKGLPEILVEKLNAAPAPIRFRILCRVSFELKPGVRPFSGPMFQPLQEEMHPVAG
ncbi:MAG: hypothetical protein WD733_08475 [Bryobacterales bacterium]